MNTRHPGRPRAAGPKPACKVAGCDREVSARGFCSTHYAYSQRGIIDPETGARLREPKRVARYAADAVCSVVGCTGRPCNRGMCNRHALQRESGILSEEGVQLRELLTPGRRKQHEKWINQRDGYVLVQAPPGHPHARHDGSILEHRLMMEQLLGRFLEEWELVHHKDGDRQNNTAENLVLLDGRARCGEGHPPGHELDSAAAVRVLLQQDDLSEELRQLLLKFKDPR